MVAHNLANVFGRILVQATDYIKLSSALLYVACALGRGAVCTWSTFYIERTMIRAKVANTHFTFAT